MAARRQRQTLGGGERAAAGQATDIRSGGCDPHVRLVPLLSSVARGRLLLVSPLGCPPGLPSARGCLSLPVTLSGSSGRLTQWVAARQRRRARWRSSGQKSSASGRLSAGGGPGLWREGVAASPLPIRGGAWQAAAVVPPLPAHAASSALLLLSLPPLVCSPRPSGFPLGLRQWRGFAARRPPLVGGRRRSRARKAQCSSPRPHRGCAARASRKRRRRRPDRRRRRSEAGRRGSRSAPEPSPAPAAPARTAQPGGKEVLAAAEEAAPPATASALSSPGRGRQSRVSPCRPWSRAARAEEGSGRSPVRAEGARRTWPGGALGACPGPARPRFALLPGVAGGGEPPPPLGGQAGEPLAPRRRGSQVEPARLPGRCRWPSAAPLPPPPPP